MAGKDKLSRGLRVFVDDSGGTARDLSGDLIGDSVNGLGFTSGVIDMTGASNDANQYLADRKDNTLTMRFHMNDTASTGASTVLNGIVGETGTVTVEIGANGADPTAGDPTFSGEFICLGSAVVADAGRLVHETTFKPYGTPEPAWGTK